MSEIFYVSFAPEAVFIRQTLQEILMEWQDQITFEDLSDWPLTRREICRAYENKHGYELSSTAPLFSDHKELSREI